MDNREQLINILTSKSNLHYDFDEIKTLDEVDLDRVIQLYKSKTSEPMSMNNRLLLLVCVYETIANNKKYKLLNDKLIDVYKIELDNKLTKNDTRYDDFNFVETDEIIKLPYTSMPEYSLILANMCTRYIYDQQESYMNDSIIPSTKFESRISIYDEIKTDFAKKGEAMPETHDQIMTQAKEMSGRIKEDRRLEEERKKQQEEMELINIQQQLIEMENEVLQLKKRISDISSQTIGYKYAELVSEQYPEEYERYQEIKEQVSNYNDKNSLISDMKTRYNKVSEDLKFYRDTLPIYENYSQRFNEIKSEFQQRRNHSISEQPMTDSSLINNNVENKIEQQINGEQLQNLINNLTDEQKNNISKYFIKQRKMWTITSIKINKIYLEGDRVFVEGMNNLGQPVKSSFSSNEFLRLFIIPSIEASAGMNLEQEEVNSTGGMHR